jgi:hypothetical protein
MAHVAPSAGNKRHFSGEPVQTGEEFLMELAAVDPQLKAAKS